MKVEIDEKGGEFRLIVGGRFVRCSESKKEVKEWKVVAEVVLKIVDLDQANKKQ